MSAENVARKWSEKENVHIVEQKTDKLLLLSAKTPKSINILPEAL